jgi:hypothetical protein
MLCHATRNRAFRSFALGEDYDGFAKFLEAEGKKLPEIFELLQEDRFFAKALAAKPVKDVLARRKKG